MDYELMMNGNVRLGQEAPDFTADSTIGKINLKEYREKWVVLFSHPGDFTPVCTTEIIAFEKAITYFKNMNTEIIGLSIDSNSSHLAWLYDIYIKTGIKISYPIIADRSGEIARKYGMIANNINNTATVRNVFIIDGKGIVRLILVYPMNIGRNISEILRVINALQISDENNQMAPANWIPCDPMIVPPPVNFESLQKRVSNMEQEGKGISWYLNFKKPENCQIGIIPTMSQMVYEDNNMKASNFNLPRTNNLEKTESNVSPNTIQIIEKNIDQSNINQAHNGQNNENKRNNNNKYQINSEYQKNNDNSINNNVARSPRNRTIHWKNFK